jgi:hypothetical protein
MSILQMRKPIAVAPPPSPLSPERARLAAAIVALREAESVYAALLVANGWDGPARAAERAAHEALTQARAGLDRAKQDAATALVDGTQPGVTVKDARLAVQSAEDDIEAAASARQTIQDRLGPAEKLVESLRHLVERHAAAVIRTEATIDTLLTKLDTHYRAIVDLGRSLDWLTDSERIPRHGPAAVPNTSYVWSLLTQAPNQWTFWHTTDLSPSANAWKAALEQLKTDAAAPLPGVQL